VISAISKRRTLDKTAFILHSAVGQIRKWRLFCAAALRWVQRRSMDKDGIYFVLRRCRDWAKTFLFCHLGLGSLRNVPTTTCVCLVFGRRATDLNLCLFCHLGAS